MIADLKEANDVILFGNKAKGLCDIIHAGLKVPYGFAIPSGTSTKEITNYVKKHCSDSKVYVVRSSSNAEDSDNNSFAGLFTTHVGVLRKDLMDKILDVMLMKNNERVKEFCKKVGRDVSTIKVAVVVQEIIYSEAAGVCFTKNPVTKKNEMYIEAVLGQGEYLVSGEITPDSYNVTKKGLVKKMKIATQHKMLTIIEGKSVEVPIFNYTKKVSNAALKKITSGALRLEKFYGKPMDIEFAIHKNNVYFLQARPITT